MNKIIVVKKVTPSLKNGCSGIWLRRFMFCSHLKCGTNTQKGKPVSHCQLKSSLVLNSTLWPVKTSIKVVRSIFSQQMSTLLLWLFLMFVTDVKTTWRRQETILMCYFGVTSFMQICFPGIVSTPVAQLLSSIPKKGRNFFYVTDTDAASSSQRPASQVWLTQVSY